jgi:hypothetical protein
LKYQYSNYGYSKWEKKLTELICHVERYRIDSHTRDSETLCIIEACLSDLGALRARHRNYKNQWIYENKLAVDSRDESLEEKFKYIVDQ